MMPTVFSDNVGRVSVINDPTLPVISRPLVQTDPEISIGTTRSIVTRITLQQKANFQFLHTLGSDIYIYVFGDRVGDLTLSGVSFARGCDGFGDRHGLEWMLDWYRENKLSARKTPIRIAIGRTTFVAFVAGMANDIVDPQSRMVQYNMSLFILPDKKRLLSA